MALAGPSDNHLHAYVAQYAIIMKDAKVLLLQRKRSSNWCLPGGRIACNESPDESLRRELREELSVSIRSSEPAEVLLIDDEGRMKYCVLFSVTVDDVSSIRISAEHRAFGYFSIEDIQGMQGIDGDEQLKKSLLKFLAKEVNAQWWREQFSRRSSSLRPARS